MSGEIPGLASQLVGKSPAAHANPWLKQAWADLKQVAEKDSTFSIELHEHGWLGLYRCASFFKFSTRKISAFSSSCDPSIASRREPDVVCNLCGTRCRSHVGLVVHRRRSHGIQSAITTFVRGNQCPRCNRCFSNVRQARRHLARYFPGTCRADNHSGYSVVCPARLICIACPSLRFGSFEQLQQHCNGHLSRLAAQISNSSDT